MNKYSSSDINDATEIVLYIPEKIEDYFEYKNEQYRRLQEEEEEEEDE